jgi:hypothetical protein
MSGDDVIGFVTGYRHPTSDTYPSGRSRWLRTRRRSSRSHDHARQCSIDRSIALFTAFADRNRPQSSRCVARRRNPVQDRPCRTTRPLKRGVSTVFDDLEFDVPSYCRTWRMVFDTAHGARLSSQAPVLQLKEPFTEYLRRDGITHGRDTYTVAKSEFPHIPEDLVLTPRARLPPVGPRPPGRHGRGGHSDAAGQLLRRHGAPASRGWNAC